MKISPSELRALALHLEAVSKNNRGHGGSGWTYDEEVAMLNRTAESVTEALNTLKMIAYSTTDLRACKFAAHSTLVSLK